MNARLILGVFIVASFCSYVVYPSVINFFEKAGQQFDTTRRINAAEISSLDLE